MSRQPSIQTGRRGVFDNQMNRFVRNGLGLNAIEENLSIFAPIQSSVRGVHGCQPSGMERATIQLSRWTKINVSKRNLHPHGLAWRNPSYANSKYSGRLTYLLLKVLTRPQEVPERSRKLIPRLDVLQIAPRLN